MTAFTIFFCGTGSNSFDFAHKSYHRGELVSTLARNHQGTEFVDWIIVDGPGSGNLQEGEKWVTPGNYMGVRGTLQGAGWEENVAHALAVLDGSKAVGRSEYSYDEKENLYKAGIIDRQLEPDFTYEYDEPPRPRISPQELQQAKVKIFRPKRAITQVNVIGWSRGGVTCHMFANALGKHPTLSHLPINIFACDPVPGLGQFHEHRRQISANVVNYVGIFAEDERSRGFTPVLPELPRTTNKFITTIPGRHATLVGNAALDGAGGEGVGGDGGIVGPGRITRDLAERCLSRWGTPLSNKLNLSDIEVLRVYDGLIGQRKQLDAMRNVSYTYFTQKGARPVGLGDGTYVDFEQAAGLAPDPDFISRHHRAVFGTRYVALYNALFRRVPLTPIRLQLELFNLKTMYPNLYKKWSAAGRF